LEKELLRMTAEHERATSIAAMQLAQMLLLRLVNSGVIPSDEAIQMLERGIEKNIRGNDDHVKVAQMFETLLSAIRGPINPKPDAS
jgi:hypothetical protein